MDEYIKTKTIKFLVKTILKTYGKIDKNYYVETNIKKILLRANI